MKIEFENEKEKEVLKHILFDWLMHNGDEDVLGCQPACRNPKAISCDICIKEMIDYQLDKFGKLEFWCYGGEDWLLQHGIDEWLEQLKERKNKWIKDLKEIEEKENGVNT